MYKLTQKTFPWEESLRHPDGTGLPQKVVSPVFISLCLAIQTLRGHCSHCPRGPARLLLQLTTGVCYDRLCYGSFSGMHADAAARISVHAGFKGKSEKPGHVCQGQDPCRQPLRGWCVKPKLQWRPQDIGDTMNKECLLRKVTGNE
jgi:hypothetical protein